MKTSTRENSTTYGGCGCYIYRLADGTSFERLRWDDNKLEKVLYCNAPSCHKWRFNYCSERYKKKCIKEHRAEIDLLDSLLEL